MSLSLIYYYFYQSDKNFKMTRIALPGMRYICYRDTEPAGSGGRVSMKYLKRYDSWKTFFKT
jgi:hypothetical protein